MGNWLTALTVECSLYLTTMGKILNKAKDRYMYWNDNYYQKTQQLTNQQEYKGKGATAFLEAVNKDINMSKPVYDGLAHVGSACANLSNVISNASTMYDSKMTAEIPMSHMMWHIQQNIFDSWREKLIQTTLHNIDNGGTNAQTINSVLQNGQASMSFAYNQAYQMVEAQVIQDATTYALQTTAIPGYLDPTKDPDIAHNPDLAQQSMAAQQGAQQETVEIHAYYLAAFNQLADEVKRDLSSWSNEIMNEYHTLQNSIQDAEKYLSARDLFDYIYTNAGGTQSTSKPITITSYKTVGGKNGLLVTIGGTDLSHIAYDTDLFTALQTGQGYNNAYLNDVRLAIQEYMREHRNMSGAEITFAGYSLGGMTAQQIAQSIMSGRDTTLNQYNLQVAQVITYGAPVMGPPSGTKYNMYDATYDPVPLLSSYENPVLSLLDSPLNPHPSALSYLLPTSAIFGIGLTAEVGTLSTFDALPWDMKLHGYIDPKGQYGSQIHNINDVGNTIIGDPHTPVFSNHLQYQNSNQLNAQSTATTNIDPSSLGPTEYFGMKNTENFPVSQQNMVSSIQKFISPYLELPPTLPILP